MQDIYTDDFVDLGSTPYHRFRTFNTKFANTMDNLSTTQVPAGAGLTGMGIVANLNPLIRNVASGVVPTAQLAGGALGAGGAALLGMRNPWSIATAGLAGGSLGSMFDSLRAIKKRQAAEYPDFAGKNQHRPVPGTIA